MLARKKEDRARLGELSTWLAMAIARQGRLAEAAQVMAPVIKFHRELSAKNRGDQWQNVELAAALYAQALTDKTRSAALLREAAAERLARHYSSIALGTLAVLAPEYDPVLVRTALHSVMQARSGGKNGAQDSE